MKTKVFDIKGIKWSFKVMSDRTFIKKHGKGLLAVTICNEHEVHFSKPYFTLQVIRHELLHVYFESCLTFDSNLKKDQVEEVCAKIFELHFHDMDALSQQLLKEFANA